MTPQAQTSIWLALAWLLYFFLHSLFAATTVKRRVAAALPQLAGHYRLAFNLVSLLLLLPLAALIEAGDGAPLWHWQGSAAHVALALRVAAVLAFVASLRSYDLSVFLGWRQLRPPGQGDGEALRISDMHRFVRHPWYFLLLVLLWTGEMSAPMLESALLITGYLVVGAWLEERKLLGEYGTAYAEYRASVGGLLPLPWKILSRQRAAELQTRASAGRATAS